MKKINPDTYQKPSRFMKFAEGDNRVRVLSDGYLYHKYSIKARGRYLSHILRDNETVPDLFQGKEPKQTYGWVVWDFATKSLKILEAGSMLGHQVALLTKDPNYQQKDIIVNRTGEMLETQYKAKFAEDKLELPHISKAEAQLYLKYFEK